jgi:hypothetical protein
LIGREEEGVLSVEDFHRLHRAEGLSIKMIARVGRWCGGRSELTVRSALT